MFLAESFHDINSENLYDYLYIYGPRCHQMVDAMTIKTNKTSNNAKSNNRCWLHSLPTNLNCKSTCNNCNNCNDASVYLPYVKDSSNSMTKSSISSLGYFGLSQTSRPNMDRIKHNWWSTWKMLPHVCKKEICCLNSSVLLTVVNSYLDRHGFC